MDRKGDGRAEEGNRLAGERISQSVTRSTSRFADGSESCRTVN